MRMRKSRAAIVVVSACMTAACSGPSMAGHAAGSPRAGTSAASAGPARPHPSAASDAIATPDSGAPRVTYSRLRTADGSVITVAVFHGDLRFVLHNGSQDPGPAAAALVRAGPAVTGAERRRLLAAFNGGFKLRSRAGGYEQEGRVIRALHPRVPGRPASTHLLAPAALA